jgi:hypothetical protein
MGKSKGWLDDLEVPKSQNGITVKDNFDNRSKQNRRFELLTKETNLSNKDRAELNKTGKIKSSRSLEYQRNILKPQAKVYQDNKSDKERVASQKAMEKVHNDKLYLEKPLIYLANPDKALGDAGLKGFDTSEKDREEIMLNRHNSYQSRLDQFKNNLEQGLSYVPDAAINVAVASLFGRVPTAGSSLGNTLRLTNETINPLAGSGNQLIRLKDAGKRYFNGRLSRQSAVGEAKRLAETGTRGLLSEEAESIVGDEIKRVKNTKQQGGKIPKAQYGKQVKYGTPEYIEAYNKGEIITDDGVRSPIALDEVVIQNNYKRDRGFWEQSRDKFLNENRDAGLFGAIGSVATYPLAVAQDAMMYGLTGKVQTPSEGMGIENPYGAMTVNMLADPTNLVGAGILTKEKALRALLASKETGLLSNAYKLNPFAFKPNPESYYRTLGKEGFEDAIQSGSIRPKQTSNVYSPELGKRINVNQPEFPEGSYFNKGDIYSKNKHYNPDYITEVKNQDNLFKHPERIVFNENIRVAPNNIPIENANFYKKDWLKGYKQIEVPKNNLNFPVENITPKPWQVKELPGLHLQSTLSEGPISRIIDKTGKVNTEQALSIIAKESGGADKVAIIKQGLGENLPLKMDYNQFRKTVQEQLIPLENNLTNHSSNYGLSNIGYPYAKRSSYETAIKNTEAAIENSTKELENFNLKTNLSPSDIENKQNLEVLLKDSLKTLAKSKQELTNVPLENQTLILSNKTEFGRGSKAHSNPDETLGHVHFLKDAETPDVLTVTQIQSDAFQGTHRIMPKNADDALQKLNELKEEGEEIKTLFSDGKESSNSVLAAYNKKLQLEESAYKNFSQKQLLDKNHQERYLQELVDYAGKRGDVNKIRVPTSETAAKVQNYTKRRSKNIDASDEGVEYILNLKNEGKSIDEIVEGIIKEHGDLGDNDLRHITEIFNNPNNFNLDYIPEHKTILKKYLEQPKTIKKLFGKEPTTVIDSKGTSWYEFDIPDKFKKGKGEIKAFTTTGIGLGAATQMQGQNIPQQKNGGRLNKYEDGGIIKDLNNLKQGGIIKDNAGQWEHPGEITRISGGNITMKPNPKTGKPLKQSLIGISDKGEKQIMHPGKDYKFKNAKHVTEYPIAKNGAKITNFTQPKKSGNWLDNL